MIMLWDTRTQGNQLSIRPDNFISNSHCAPGKPTVVFHQVHSFQFYCFSYLFMLCLTEGFSST